MHPTGSAELSQFETLSIVLFVFRGRVVAVLAVRTSQRHNNAILFAFTSHVFLRSGFGCIVSNPGPRTIPLRHGRGQGDMAPARGATTIPRGERLWSSIVVAGLAPLPCPLAGAMLASSSAVPTCRCGYRRQLPPCVPLPGSQNAPLLPSPPAAATPPSSRCCPPASPSPLLRAA